jgi:hypothetical protein
VWEADDAVLGRRVALKVLVQELADDARATKRFVRVVIARMAKQGEIGHSREFRAGYGPCRLPGRGTGHRGNNHGGPHKPPDDAHLGGSQQRRQAELRDVAMP